jgi:hypothetical protein
MEDKKEGRGGKRERAGRPKGTTTGVYSDTFMAIKGPKDKIEAIKAKAKEAGIKVSPFVIQCVLGKEEAE